MNRSSKKAAGEGRPKRVRRLAAGLLAALAVFLWTPPGRAVLDGLYSIAGFGGRIEAPFSLHILDVGKADAMLIECQGHVALIDAGTALHGETVVDYMARLRMGNTLDYVIVSHPDSDHLGGVPQALRELSCEEFVRSPYFDGAYEAVREVLREKSIPQRIVGPGDVLPLGEAALEIIGPLRQYEDTNNSSLVIRVRFRGVTALLCGDIESQAEADLVHSGEDLSTDLLKVAHHGSKTSTTQEFLDAVAPRLAVISTGPDNNQLPAESVLIRLEQACQAVYRTDVDGTVVFSAEEDGLAVRIERGTGP